LGGDPAFIWEDVQLNVAAIDRRIVRHPKTCDITFISILNPPFPLLSEIAY
jgi:hypothetical protein